MKKKSKTKIARVYSTALYEAAVSENSVEAIWNDVKKLKKLLVENADFTSYMVNPLWTEKDKADGCQC